MEYEDEDEAEWHEAGRTAEGYPVFESDERPGVQRIAVPAKVWAAMFLAPLIQVE